MSLPPPPINDVESTYNFKEWLNKIYQYVGGAAGLVPWATVDKTGSSLADLATKNHSSLDAIAGSTDGYHLSSTQYTDLTDGGDSTLHYHSADRAGGTVTAPSTVSVGATSLTFDREIPITIDGTTYYILCKSTTSV